VRALYLVIIPQHPDETLGVLHGHLLDELLVGQIDVELEPEDVDGTKTGMVSITPRIERGSDECLTAGTYL
jgi:hypothetical protein